MKMCLAVYPCFLKKISFAFILLIALIVTGQAQSNNGNYDYRSYYEFGTIDSSLLKNSVYKKDPTASAVILYDKGRCISEPYRGIELTVHRIIKIFKEDAVRKWGQLQVETSSSKMVEFSGIVYNYENGQVIKEKVGMSDLLLEGDKKNKVSSIAFPNVRAGSIIEYTYKVSRHQYGIYFWTFQQTIPVFYSEYEVFYPGEATTGTQTLINGMHLLDVTSRQKGRLKTYRLYEIPAFVEEPYMLNPRWYISSIEFPDAFMDGKPDMYRLMYIEEHGITRDTTIMDTKTMVDANFKIDPKGFLIGSLQLRWSGNEARLTRNEILNIGEEQFLKDVYKGKQWDVSKQELENIDNDKNDLIARYELSIPDNIQVTDSLLYINPFLALKEEQNPFLLEKRLYPVDLISRTERTMVAQLIIPEGYTIDEIPKSEILALPNKAGTFTASVTHQGGKIYITSRIKFNKIIFNVPEYPSLREFYRQIIAKRSALIVLRRVNH